MSISAQPVSDGEEVVVAATGTIGVMESLLSVSQGRHLEESGTSIDSLLIPSQMGSTSVSWNDVEAAKRPVLSDSDDTQPKPAPLAKSRAKRRGKSQKQRQREVELANAELTALLDAFQRGDAVPVIPGERSALELPGQGDILGKCEEWIMGESQHGESIGRNAMPAAVGNVPKLAFPAPITSSTSHTPELSTKHRVKTSDPSGSASESFKRAATGTLDPISWAQASTLVVAELHRDLARAKEAHAVAVAAAERQRADTMELLLSRAISQLQGQQHEAEAPFDMPPNVIGSAVDRTTSRRGESSSTIVNHAATSSGVDSGAQALRAARLALAQLSRSEGASTSKYDSALPSESRSDAVAAATSSSASGSATQTKSLEARMQALHDADVLLSGADYARRMMQEEGMN